MGNLGFMPYGGNNQLGFMPDSFPMDSVINQWPDLPQQYYMSNIVASQTIGAGASTSQSSNSAWVFPMAIQEPLLINQIKIPVFVSVTTANSSDHYQMTQGLYLGIYTKNLSSLSLLSSFSNQMTLTYSSAANSTNASATVSMVYGGTNASLTSSSSLSTNNAGVTNFWSSLSNTKMFPFLGGTDASFSGGQYYGVFAVSQNSATKNNASLVSIGHNSLITQTNNDVLANVASTSGNFQYLGLVPIVQYTNAILPNTIALSNIQSSSNNVTIVNRSVYIQMNRI